jgi:hypothetical protein
MIDRDIGNLVRHPGIVVLLHPFRMSSFSVNSFNSVEGLDITKGEKTTVLLVYSGAWGKLIHEKKPEVENLVTLS